MGNRGTNTRGTGGSARRRAVRGGRRGRAVFSAVVLVACLVVIGVVFFRLLPEVRGGADDLPLAQERQQFGPPAAELVEPPEAYGDAMPPGDAVLYAYAEPDAPEPLPGEDPEQIPYEHPAPDLPPPPAGTREQGLFFIQVENDGEYLLLTRVSRTVEVSDTPLIDSLNALLLGPNAREADLGLESFITPGARILNVRIEGRVVENARWDTAVIDFNEDFQYNTRGSEGLYSQLKQIVWTATEFPNVRDVQILIEGDRVEFLHGGIRIGSPIGRQR